MCHGIWRMAWISALIHLRAVWPIAASMRSPPFISQRLGELKCWANLSGCSNRGDASTRLLFRSPRSTIFLVAIPRGDALRSSFDWQGPATLSVCGLAVLWSLERDVTSRLVIHSIQRWL